jgi:hypothetical protein
MHEGRSNYPKFQFHEKTLSSQSRFGGLGSLVARGKGIRVFSVFCLRLRSGYVKRVETIRLSSVSDPKKKIAGIRVSTVSPVIASSRNPLLLRGPGRKSQFPIGSLP